MIIDFPPSSAPTNTPLAQKEGSRDGSPWPLKGWTDHQNPYRRRWPRQPVEDGTKRWIPSPEILFAIGKTWADVLIVPDGGLSSLPDGPDVQPPIQPDPVEVLDVTESEAESAVESIRNAGLEPRFSGTTERPAHVIRQLPAGGERVHRGQQ